MSGSVAASQDRHTQVALIYGSVVSHVEELCIERGFSNKSGGANIDRVARESGISTATLYYLFKRPESFRALNFITAAKLCRLLKCDIGDLFSYVPGLTSQSLGINTSLFAGLKGTTTP